MFVVLVDLPDAQDVFVALYATRELAEERAAEEQAHDVYFHHYHVEEEEVATTVDHRPVRPIAGRFGSLGARAIITDLRDPDLVGD